GCPFRVRAPALYPAARCDAVCGVAEGAHGPRLPLLPDVPCSSRGDFVSHADRERRDPKADGAMEHSPRGGRTHGGLCPGRRRRPSGPRAAWPAVALGTAAATHFPSRRSTMSELNGCRVAVLVTDGFEESELTEPVRALREAGARVTILSPRAGEIQGVRHD